MIMRVLRQNINYDNKRAWVLRHCPPMNTKNGQKAFSYRSAQILSNF